MYNPKKQTNKALDTVSAFFCLLLMWFQVCQWIELVSEPAAAEITELEFTDQLIYGNTL